MYNCTNLVVSVKRSLPAGERRFLTEENHDHRHVPE